MGYKEEVARLRRELDAKIKQKDRDGARAAAMSYATLFRTMAKETDSFLSRVTLNKEAEKYEYVAAVIISYGIGKELEKALQMSESPLSKSHAANPAVSSSISAKQTPVSKKSTAPAKPTQGSSNAGSFFKNLGSGSAKPPSASPRPKPSNPVQPYSIPSTGDDWEAVIMEKLSPAVFIVLAGNSTGTGFFISPDGYFLTNHHVVHDDNGDLEDYIHVVSDDDKQDYSVKFIKADKKLDVALLKAELKGKRVPCLPIIKDYSAVKAGQTVMLIGNGLDYGLAPITGTIKFPKQKSTGKLIYTAPTNNGDSGSPVINKNGYVVGIHKSSTASRTVGTVTTDVKGISNGTAACDILALLDKWGIEI